MNGIGNKEVFARNLSMYMERNAKSQRELAEIVGVAPSTFSEWVNARKYPRIDKIEMLANYFGILKSDLIEEKEENNSPDKLQLSEGEQMILDLFRRVPEDQQKLVLQMIRAALGSQE